MQFCIFLGVKFGLKILLRVKKLTLCNSDGHLQLHRLAFHLRSICTQVLAERYYNAPEEDCKTYLFHEVHMDQIGSEALSKNFSIGIKSLR